MNPVTIQTAPRVPNTKGFDAHRLHATDHAEVIHIALAPGANLPRHSVPVDAFFYVLEGTATVELDSGRVTLDTGTLMPSAARSPHKIVNEAAGLLRFLVVKTPKPAAPARILE